MRPPSAPNLAFFPLASLAPTLALAGLLGCQPRPLPLDAGDEAGARRALPGCSNPLRVVGMMGTISVPIDTRFGEPGRVTLPAPSTASTCASTGSALAPQTVIAYEVPGTGMQTVEVSTVNAGTDRNFDTIIAIRGERCVPINVDEPPLACFDDERLDHEPRSRGAFVAEGGTTVYIVVGGYGAMYMGRADEGLATLDITAQAISAPTIDSASVLLTDGAVRVEAVGGDVGRDATGVWLTFHGAAGEQFDLDSNGVFDDGDVLTGNFDRPVLGAPTFMETATLIGGPVGGAPLVRVRLVDRAGTRSERAITAPGVMGRVVGPGDACGGTNVCGPELACDGMMMCSPAADRVAACAAAEAIDLVAPTDGRAITTLRQSVLMAGAGLFSSPSGCAEDFTGGAEDVYRVRVPPGRYDVTFTTDSSGSAGTTLREPDTVLYVRRTCTDAGPTSARPEECNDDTVSGTNYRSTVDIADIGDVELSVFVEIYGGPPKEGVRYELATTLRPVLAPGQMCDPAGMDNRCATGTCPVGTRMCP